MTILPITDMLLDAPSTLIMVQPDDRNGLTEPSQIMVDKLQTPFGGRLGPD